MIDCAPSAASLSIVQAQGPMKKIILDDILGFSAYEIVREQFRQGIIERKKARRIAVGDKISLVFENRDTVIFQIQEMLRAERITDLDKIREEIAVYNELIPDAGELSATMFLEIEDQTHLRDSLLKFLGIDEALSFKIGASTVAGRFEEGRSKEDKISAVQYVRFRLDSDAQKALMGGARAELTVNHQNYQASQVLSPDQQKSLAQDLVD
jgi:recombinational DNA repair ATPase RecF